MSNIQWPELIIFTALFVLVTVLGFLASRWKAAASLDHLDEWGLGGRKFGSWVTWFLIGGDLYTAYTFVADVPQTAARFWVVPETCACQAVPS